MKKIWLIQKKSNEEVLEIVGEEGGELVKNYSSKTTEPLPAHHQRRFNGKTEFGRKSWGGGGL